MVEKQTRITIGAELEMTQVSPEADRLFNEHGFGRRSDASIKDNRGVAPAVYGVELVTGILEVPVSMSPNGDNDVVDLTSAARTIAALTRCAGTINSTCGFHLHLGRPNGQPSEWNPRRVRHNSGGPMSEWKPGHVRTMLAIGLGLEDKLFSVVPESRRSVIHCRRIREIYPDHKLRAYYPISAKDLRPRKYDNKQRYCWLNLVETCRPSDPSEERVGYARSTALGTIEVRNLGETANTDYILAWTKLWTMIGAAVAYLPAESAILRCLYSGWLDQTFHELAHHKEKHERDYAPLVRSVIPQTNGNHTEED